MKKIYTPIHTRKVLGVSASVEIGTVEKRKKYKKRKKHKKHVAKTHEKHKKHKKKRGRPKKRKR